MKIVRQWAREWRTGARLLAADCRSALAGQRELWRNR